MPSHPLPPKRQRFILSTQKSDLFEGTGSHLSCVSQHNQQDSSLFDHIRATAAPENCL